MRARACATLSFVAPEFIEDSTTRVPADRGRIRIPSVTLAVIEGPSRGKRVALTSGLATIGSAPDNPLVLDDKAVSRLHCEIRVRPFGITLRDPGSTNGTFIEGVRVRDADVPAGAIVRLGGSAFRVEVGDEPAFVPLSDRQELGFLVGGSVEMRRVYALLERVSPTDSTVLIQGETGTGKDVAARTIHDLSRRRAGPFVPLDCGAVPANLFESELFGHVRGAFSGATADRQGVFEEADGGTLFLDEIGEIPLDLQPKLLRALETKTVRPVGSNRARPVDIRVVAATNRPLAQAVNEGAFREDLYYRLAVVDVTLPPLRARPEDIEPLARHFYRQLRGPSADLPGAFARTLASREWPGNVRALKNFVERAVALGFIDAPAGPSTPPDAVGSTPAAADQIPLDRPLKDARQAWILGFESVYVRHVLARAQGNVTHAAELAGVSRRFLQRLIARLGLRTNDPSEGT
jgi:transcriptional regulator with PAS, ATPase and Fis domain